MTRSSRRHAASALLAMAALGAGCAGLVPPPPSPPAVDQSVPSAPIGPEDPAFVLAPFLTPASRDLLTVVAPEEEIDAVVTTSDPSGVASIARSSGLSVFQVSPDEVMVSGGLRAVLAVVAAVHPDRVVLTEDQRAERWIPDARPDVVIPVPGAPYRAAPMPVDGSNLHMTVPQRAALVSVLAAAVVTIDGRPYDRIDISGECSGRPPTCTLRMDGSTAASGGRVDSYLVTSDDAAGVTPHVDATTLGAVPRPIARAAEWIARHDPKAAAAIATYQTCCDALWDPAHPGRIEIVYVRPCHLGIAPTGHLLAATGDCFATVAIQVDVGAGTVVAIEPRAGP
jgi:hypothetical protein